MTHCKNLKGAELRDDKSRGNSYCIGFYSEHRIILFKSHILERNSEALENNKNSYVSVCPRSADINSQHFKTEGEVDSTGRQSYF